MRSFLILFAAIAPPALLYSALSETDFAAVRELAPWALQLLGFGGLAVAVRARGRVRPPAPGIRSPTPPRRAAGRMDGLAAGSHWRATR